MSEIITEKPKRGSEYIFYNVSDVQNNKQIENLLKHNDVLEYSKNQDDHLSLSNCIHPNKYSDKDKGLYASSRCLLCLEIYKKSHKIVIQDDKGSAYQREFISNDDYEKFKNVAYENIENKLINMIKSRITREEEDQFMKYGKTGLSLFDCCHDVTQYDHIDNFYDYIHAIIENMRGSVNEGGLN